MCGRRRRRGMEVPAMNEPMNKTSYYIEAMGSIGTSIAGRFVEPGKPPLEFTAGQYKEHLRVITHYRNRGVILVHEPGSLDAARAAHRIKADLELKNQPLDTQVPPPPISIGVPLGETATPLMATFSAPSGDDYVMEQCLAVTTSGSRCKREPLEESLLCVVHNKILKQGRQVKAHGGGIISADGKSVRHD